MLRPLRALAVAALIFGALPACTDGAPDTSTSEEDVTDSTGRFELFVAEDGSHSFQLLAKNGERLVRSQSYSSLSAAKNGITSVKKNGLVAARFKVLGADNGEAYFNLTAANGQVIATSDAYATSANAQTGINAVIKALAKPTSADAETSGTRFETFTGQDARTYFRLRAQNGQIVLQSQGYASKSSAQKGIDSVEANGIDATRYDVIGSASGQHTFRLVALNGKTIARGEMYASKSGALAGAGRVRELLRELTGEGEASDAEVHAEIETATQDLLFMSESDYPFQLVSAPLAAGGVITEALVREKLASFVDGDPAADKPMATLFAREESWQSWKDAGHSCADPGDPDAMVLCSKMRNLEQVLESNLSDLRVFYFGKKGKPGQVDGIGVSIFIVGVTPSGQLSGVRTLAIWT